MTNVLIVVAKVFSNQLIFFCKNVGSFMQKLLTFFFYFFFIFFSAKHINEFAIFQDINFNVTLPNSYVKF